MRIREEGMKGLARAEEIILLTILKLGDQAYGVSIRDRIHRDTGELWSFASIYTPLDKMKRKRLVEKIPGNPSPERGGKRKYFYRISASGRGELAALLESRRKLWRDVPALVSDGRGEK